MAAIKHKLRTRSSSGAPLAFSARAGVVLLKTFASIRPLRIYPQWQSGVLSGQKTGFHARPKRTGRDNRGSRHVRFGPPKADICLGSKLLPAISAGLSH